MWYFNVGDNRKRHADICFKAECEVAQIPFIAHQNFMLSQERLSSSVGPSEDNSEYILILFIVT
jgi:hypothetical protein